MALYAVVFDLPIDDGVAKIQARFVDAQVYPATRNTYFFASDLTTQEVHRQLNPAQDASLGRYILMRVSNYNGWQSKDLWEWLGTRVGDRNG